MLDAHIGKEYLRALSSDGDHVALAQAWIGESGPFPLKVYTYKGTSEDDRRVHLISDEDPTASIEFRLHGLITYDYVTIVRALQDDDRNWLGATALQDYKEVRDPLALVVFGEAAD